MESREDRWKYNFELNWSPLINHLLSPIFSQVQPVPVTETFFFNLVSSPGQLVISLNLTGSRNQVWDGGETEEGGTLPAIYRYCSQEWWSENKFEPFKYWGNCGYQIPLASKQIISLITMISFQNEREPPLLGCSSWKRVVKKKNWNKRFCKTGDQQHVKWDFWVCVGLMTCSLSTTFPFQVKVRRRKSSARKFVGLKG